MKYFTLATSIIYEIFDATTHGSITFTSVPSHEIFIIFIAVEVYLLLTAAQFTLVTPECVDESKRFKYL